MVQYIKQLLRELADCLSDLERARSVQSRLTDVAEGLNRLDPPDFMPSSQAHFVNLRRLVRIWADVGRDWWEVLVAVANHHGSEPEYGLDRMQRMRDWVELGEEVGRSANGKHLATHILAAIRSRLRELEQVLDEYRGQGLGYPKREFLFVQDAALKRIVERDYQELRMKVFPSESHKSAVILAGSILEALLYDLILRDPSRVAAAMAWSNAPKKPDKGTFVKRDIASTDAEDAWPLEKLIDVCLNVLKVLPEGKGRLIDQALRNHRNLVHPRAEVRLGISIGLPDAHSAFGALEGVIEHIEANYP